MLTKLIEPGCKVEMQLISRKLTEEEKKVYISKVFDVLSEDRMEILMPMEKTRLILLPVDGEIDITFYAGEYLYQCFTRVVDRYKRDNMYILLMEATSNLRKVQRREYYRFSCALEMCSRLLVEEEIKAVEEHRNYYLIVGGRTKQCETVGEILSARELEHKKGTFEHRVRYVDMGEGEREEIIRYIFEEERKNRKKESEGH